MLYALYGPAAWLSRKVRPGRAGRQESAGRGGMVLRPKFRSPHMPYLSGIIGKPVHDATGEAFDSIADLVIYHGTEKFPRLTGILLNGDRSRVAVIPWTAVAEFTPDGVRLRVERRSLAPRPLQPDEILLREDVLDTQVVDTDDIKVVRVNDLELRQVGNEMRV